VARLGQAAGVPEDAVTVPVEDRAKRLTVSAEAATPQRLVVGRRHGRGRLGRSKLHTLQCPHALQSVHPVRRKV